MATLAQQLAILSSFPSPRLGGQNETRALALRVLQELVRTQGDLISDYACLTVMKILEACNDIDKGVCCPLFLTSPTSPLHYFALNIPTVGHGERFPSGTELICVWRGL